MKFLAITLLAVCLIQGNNAQFGALRKLVSGAKSAVTNTASGAVNAVSDRASGVLSGAVNTASGAVNAVSGRASGVLSGAVNTASGAVNAVSDRATDVVNGAVDRALDLTSNVAKGAVDTTSGILLGALDTASGISKGLPGAAQDLINSATASVSIDSLTEAASKLSPDELIQTVNGAAAQVNTIVSGIQSQLEETVNSVSEKAEASLNGATSLWNNPVQAVVQKALAAGVDVKDCAVDSVANMAKDSVSSAVSCVTDRVNEAVTLVKNIAGLPVTAASIAKDGSTGLYTCQQKKNNFMKRACQVTTLAPLAVKSALLVKDTITYAAQATTLVTTLHTQLTTCAADVVAKTGVQAATTGGNIISCVRGKMTN